MRHADAPVAKPPDAPDMLPLFEKLGFEVLTTRTPRGGLGGPGRGNPSEAAELRCCALSPGDLPQAKVAMVEQTLADPRTEDEG